MAVICSFCKTDKQVRRDFITLWNGSVYDLCIGCAKPIAQLIDTGHYGVDSWPDRAQASRAEPA